MNDKTTAEFMKTVELGQEFELKELRKLCQAVWGGVCWPDKREGFAVVVGMDQQRHLDSYDIYLLDECKSDDTYQLVRQCGVLNYKYCPDRWIGENKNDAASQFIQEMNNEYEQIKRTSRHDFTVHKRQFSIEPTLMLEMKKLYPYILAEIKRLLDEKHRLLELKNSKILSYLREIEEGETATLELGEYPAIEALAFVVIEMRKYIRMVEETAHLPKNDDPYKGWRPGRGNKRTYQNKGA